MMSNVQTRQDGLNNLDVYYNATTKKDSQDEQSILHRATSILHRATSTLHRAISTFKNNLFTTTYGIANKYLFSKHITRMLKNVFISEIIQSFPIFLFRGIRSLHLNDKNITR